MLPRLSLLVALVALFALPKGASAHGGVVQLDAYYGAYHVVAMSNPTVGDGLMLLTVVITENAAGDVLGHPVLNSGVVAVFERADPPRVAPISFTIPPE